MIGLLAACVALQVVTAGPLDLETLYVAEEDCEVGAWTVACPNCTPPWSRTTTVDCSAGEAWSVELLDQALANEGGLQAAREARPADDWTITGGVDP